MFAAGYSLFLVMLHFAAITLSLRRLTTTYLQAVFHRHLRFACSSSFFSVLPPALITR